MRAMSGLGLEEGSEGDQDMGFMPMMQHMMKSLLSKEVLYPSLKEISAKVIAKKHNSFRGVKYCEFAAYTIIIHCKNGWL